HTAKLLRRLAEKPVSEGSDQLMRTLVPLVHQRFEGRVRVRLIEQQPRGCWDRYIRLHVSEDFKPRLNRDLRLHREERILSAASSQRDGRIYIHLGIRGSGN